MDNKLKKLFNKIIEIIQQFQNNKILQYFEIGKAIFAHNQFTNKDKSLDVIGIELDKEYPKSGYKRADLYWAEKLYKTYKENPDQFKLAQQLEWAHNKTILSIIDDKLRLEILKFAIETNISEKQLKIEIKQRDGQKKLKEEGFKINIENIEIKNFKSIVDLKIEKPNPFTVFVGPNAVGKSNIFDAIEMLINSKEIGENKLFEDYKGEENFINFNNFDNINAGNHKFELKLNFHKEEPFKFEYSNKKITKSYTKNPVFSQLFYNSFSRLLATNFTNRDGNSNKLLTNCSNLNDVLKRILENDDIKDEIIEWLELFIPGFNKIEFQTQLDGSQKLLLFEKNISKPIEQNLISEGTKQILKLLTAIYQSANPQFLIIEEPENGLNPKIKKEIVHLLRTACEDLGHYIWITTHSQTLVDELTKTELIVVDKIEGQTILNTDFRKKDFGDIKLGEAWINGLLKGGIPW